VRAGDAAGEDLSEILAVLSGVMSSLDLSACDPRDTLADLGVDSLSLIQLVAALETRFAVRLSNEELESLGTATLADVARLCRRGSDAGVPAPESARAVVVRAYREADRAGLRRICIEETSLGTFRELSPLFFLEQYCDADPASCFVAEVEGQLVGYWVGTLDVARLQRDFPRADHRRFWRLVVVERQPSRARTALMARLGGDLFGRTYVHFQVDRKSAPAGTVFALANAWLDYLRGRGLQGALLPSVPGGEAALEMWKRVGFAPVRVTTPVGEPATWLVAIL
jgi:acyl carrier protein